MRYYSTPRTPGGLSRSCLGSLSCVAAAAEMVSYLAKRRGQDSSMECSTGGLTLARYVEDTKKTSTRIMDIDYTKSSNARRDC